jgi:hypothetical protein
LEPTKQALLEQKQMLDDVEKLCEELDI